MNEYFPKQKLLGGIMKVELDLSNYTIKADLKDIAVDDTQIALDLAFDLDLDIGKLENLLQLNYSSSFK